MATFQAPHKEMLVGSKGKKSFYTDENFLIQTEDPFLIEKFKKHPYLIEVAEVKEEVKNGGTNTSRTGSKTRRD